MAIKVAKFGGSSLADAGQFQKVAAIIRRDPERRFVVASAPGKRDRGDEKVTDMLYACFERARAHEDFTGSYRKIADRFIGIVRELNLDLDLSEELCEIQKAIAGHAGRDFAASRGEYLNAKILARYLGYDFIDAESVIFFRDDGSFDEEKTDSALKGELVRHRYAVIPGFYGAMPNGTVKTFSRGGSDVTGSIVARAVDADRYENWTDVSGCLMADPRIVPNPATIQTVTYRELRELSYMGASVLHEEAIFPVRSAGIPINIRNTNRPDEAGTMIVASTNGYDTAHVITGVAGKRGFSVINIEKGLMNNEIGFARRVLDVLEDNGISMEHLPSGVDTMSVLVSTADLEGKRERILSSIHRNTRAESILIEDGLALLAVVGRGMVKARGTAARVFDAVSGAGINIRMIDQGSSELNIIISVEEQDLNPAINAIYREFVG